MTLIFQDEIFKKFRQFDRGEFVMLHILKKIFCIHVYEYERDENSVQFKECRKCGAHHH